MISCLGFLESIAVLMDLNDEDCLFKVVLLVLEACTPIKAIYCGSYVCDRDLIHVLDSFKKCFRCFFLLL